jgi:SET domain-containing protein
MGRGIKTLRDLEIGSLLLEYAGEFVPSQHEIEKREAEYTLAKKGCYVLDFPWNSRLAFIDATAESTRLGRLINHDAAPNCRPILLRQCQPVRVVFKAICFITSGTQLLWDYYDLESTENWLQRPASERKGKVARPL